MAAALATGGAPSSGGGTGGNGGGRRGAAQTYDRLQWGDFVAFYVEDKVGDASQFPIEARLIRSMYRDFWVGLIRIST